MYKYLDGSWDLIFRPGPHISILLWSTSTLFADASLCVLTREVHIIINMIMMMIIMRLFSTDSCCSILICWCYSCSAYAIITLCSACASNEDFYSAINVIFTHFYSSIYPSSETLHTETETTTLKSNWNHLNTELKHSMVENEFHWYVNWGADWFC